MNILHRARVPETEVLVTLHYKAHEFINAENQTATILLIRHFSKIKTTSEQIQQSIYVRIYYQNDTTLCQQYSRKHGYLYDKISSPFAAMLFVEKVYCALSHVCHGVVFTRGKKQLVFRKQRRGAIKFHTAYKVCMRTRQNSVCK